MELSHQGQALLSRLKAAWQQLAAQTVAGVTSSPLDQITDVLTDVASSLTGSHSAAHEPARDPRDTA